MDYCLANDDGAAAIWNGQPNLDLDGDGRLDAIGLDLDGDGMQDDALADFDGDGMADHAVLDLDNDWVRATPTPRNRRLGGAQDHANATAGIVLMAYSTGEFYTIQTFTGRISAERAQRESNARPLEPFR